MTGEAVSGDASPDLTTTPRAPWAQDQGEAPASTAVDVTQEPDPPPNEHILAERANATLIARWSHDTQARFIMDFIREHGLFPSLNTFLKKRIR